MTSVDPISLAQAQRLVANADTILLRRGDRIAQLVVQRFERARFVAVADLPERVRGSGGYGSTGGFGPGNEQGTSR